MPKLLIQILILVLAGVLFTLFTMFCLYHYERELQLKDAYIQREYVRPNLYCKTYDCSQLSHQEIIALADTME